MCTLRVIVGILKYWCTVLTNVEIIFSKHRLTKQNLEG